MTLGNLICGFAAIHFCMRAMLGDGLRGPVAAGVEAALAVQPPERLLPSFLSIAAGFIFVGLLADALDGSLARWTKRTSDFGGQLDSLADIVTFGVAPAMLVVAVLLNEPGLGRSTMPGPLSGNLAGRAMWMMLAVYVGCAALRLARFNVEHARGDLAHQYFSGLPSPGAAVVLASLILVHEHVGETLRPYLALALPHVALALGLLMVSRVRYMHLANAYLRGRRPFGQVVGFMVLLAVFWWYKELTLAVVVSVYAISGPIAAVVRRIRYGPRPEQPVPESSDVSAPTAEAGSDQHLA